MNVSQLLQQAQALRLTASSLITKPAEAEHRELEAAGATATLDHLIREGAPPEQIKQQLGLAKTRYEAAQKREHDLAAMCERFSTMFVALSEAATATQGDAASVLSGELVIFGQTFDELRGNLQTAMLDTAAAAALAGVTTAMSPGSHIIRPAGFEPKKLIIPGKV